MNTPETSPFLPPNQAPMPFPRIPAEQQYRPLKAGEIIQPGDEWQDMALNWHKKANAGVGEAYKPEPDYGGVYHYPHRRPLPDWEALYCAEVIEKNWWKEPSQKALAKLDEARIERDEAVNEISHLKDVLADANKNYRHIEDENRALNVELSLARTMLNGQERRHKEEVAKLNSNYLQVMTERDGMRRALADVAMVQEAWMPKPPQNLREDIIHAINCRNAESGSDTPDWILGNFLIASLAAFDMAVKDRTQYYALPDDVPQTDTPAPTEG